MPPIPHCHQSQFCQMPPFATSPETTSGVSAAKVVAIIAEPASHHETARPATKYSSSDSPPFFVNFSPIPIDSAK